MTPVNTRYPTTKPVYGNWPSPITADLIVSDSIGLDEAKQVRDTLYYLEKRPQEAGRCVIVKISDGETVDVLPEPYSARSRVHEYGGGCYCIHEDTVFFINDSDQDIYQVRNRQISRITTAADQRFADFSYDQKFDRLIAVCETHENNNVTNSIVSIDISNGLISEIETGSDFYASPRVNRPATKLCWQSWNHPNMPWDGNQLWAADITHDGELLNKKHIAGDNSVAVFQPQWSPGGVLHFVSDDTGWWHLYRCTDCKQHDGIEQLTTGEKELGLPQWVFAQSTYAFINDTDIICCYQSDGSSRLAKLSLSDQPELVDIDTDWQMFSSITADAESIGFIAASRYAFPQLVSAKFSNAQATTLITDVIKTSCSLPVTSEYYSEAQAVEFINRNNQRVFANYYPPKNPEHQAYNKTPPPLIVICHGGPTGQSDISLDARKQFWTSRGFALLDVNYSGSTGYGREYRTRLYDRWGKLDVEDCCDAALYAVSQGMANEDQLIIRGSSAGGYTVLAALTFEQVFSAGASYYGISELSSLATDTHKFESRYLDRLIGPYPQSMETYQQRSPINHTEQLNCPVIFFQGIDDRVVPKEQAEKMFAALKDKGLPVAAQYFEGEQHGFRKAETIKQTLENELAFYQLIFDLKPGDKVKFKGDVLLENT